MASKNTVSVLFVCLGNICRSPAAEGLFAHYVSKQDQDDRFRIDSAGTAGYHEGNLADPRMREAAERRGIELSSRSRKIEYRDLESFDYVIAMDRENLADILRVHDAPAAKVQLLSDFLGDNWPNDVPDPYYGGADGFEMVLDMLKAACPAMLDEFSSMFES